MPARDPYPASAAIRWDKHWKFNVNDCHVAFPVDGSLAIAWRPIANGSRRLEAESPCYGWSAALVSIAGGKGLCCPKSKHSNASEAVTAPS